MNPSQTLSLKTEITRTLQGCASGPLGLHATALLGALGYHSDRTTLLSPNTFSEFQDVFLNGDAFHEQKALAAEWKSVDLLFQYTDSEVKTSSQLALDVFADPRFEAGLYQSFVFFAVDLAGDSYTRTQLADATREINKPFGMPAILVFRHGATLTLAVIDRRPNKRDSNKDVLEKVTLIKDIRVDPNIKPHRAHIEILFDLALDNLLENYAVTNFDTLHTAWRKTLDTAALNKKFYKELADWYFWALKHVTFPHQAGVDKEVNSATSVIRLITRLMFTWFLKERGLVSEDLFDDLKLTALLQENSLRGDDSTYYKAILQNLFFATLNTEMDDPAHPRRFQSRNHGQDNDSRYDTPNVLCYDSSFHDTVQALTLFAQIPFLNGGLFECLDRTPSDAPRVLVDGFSDRDDNPLRVPNFLFFSDSRDVDLNAVYGTLGKTTKVRGLLTILHSYKFTVTENTPIEEEIALDPELLGRVFENLLASYNPETGATARKQTGSFYTPREIVNYMVDEALIASLETALSGPSPFSSDSPITGGGGASLNARLRHLFAYNTDAPDFTPTETRTLIGAIDTLKILDPACGSGAFPMGILQKLVFVLGKLDPHNQEWRDRQIAKAEAINEPAAREHAVADIEQAFAKNDLDYGRKLYLISNGIYGVDIQPIAMQIAKLRFFISLIIDQRIDDNAPNRGVRALPNLETKFVAANALLGIDKDIQPTLPDQSILERQAALKRVRESYFSARTPAKKEKCKEEDKRLRGEISALLESSGLPHATALRLAGWDPYDPGQTADFFDPDWMYSVTEGFDICLANPPYIRQESIRDQKPALKAAFPQTFNGTADLYTYFYSRAVQLLKPGGMLAYITPNKWFRAGYGSDLRKYIAATCHVDSITDFGELPVFEAATFPMVFVAQRRNGATTHTTPTRFTQVKSLAPPYPDIPAIVAQTGQDLPADAIRGADWTLTDTASSDRLRHMEKVGVPLGEYVDGQIFYGIKTGFNKAFVLTGEERANLIAQDPKSAEIIKPLAVGDDIRRWRIESKDRWLIVTKIGVDIKRYPAIFNHLKQWQPELEIRSDKGPNWWELRACAYYNVFDEPKIVYPEIAKEPRFSMDLTSTYPLKTAFSIPSSDKYLLGVLNSALAWGYLKSVCSVLGDPEKGGRLTQQTIFVSKLPIPTASAAEQKVVATLSEYLLYLHSPEGKIGGTAEVRDSLMRDYFEQIINGLVHELYFPEETHAQNIRLFDLAAKGALLGLDDIPQSERLTRLRGVFETLYDQNHPLRGTLFQLGSVSGKA